MTNERKAIIRSQTTLDLESRIINEKIQIAVIGRFNRFESRIATFDDLNDFLPIGARRLGNVAVEQLVFIVNDDVL